jgi:hypothetical protein
MKVDAKHLRELMNKAAPLPWPGPGILRPTRGSDGITAPAAVWLEAPRHVTVDRSDLLHADDAELAVEAVNALPSLLAELDALREVEAAQGKLLRKTYLVVDALMVWDNNLLDEPRVCESYKACVNNALNLVGELEAALAKLDKVESK